jgi:hypothetical protein
MFSASKLIAGAVVLALSGTLLWSGVFTPPAEEQRPGAEAVRTDFVIATGTSEMFGSGPYWRGNDAMSDPRVSGDIELINNYDTGSEDLTGVQWGQLTITNDGGTWDGEWIGFYEEGGEDSENATAWLRGTGGYDGWSYVVNYSGPMSELGVRGLIYQGDIPPTVVLGLPEPAAE